MASEAEILHQLGEVIGAGNPFSKADKAERLLSTLTHELITLKREAEAVACNSNSR